jgi:pantothenate synthetase
MLVEQAEETDPSVVESAMKAVLAAHHIQIDYAAIRHPHTLARIDCIAPSLTHGVVALIAGRLNGVRLIDNMILERVMHFGGE